MDAGEWVNASRMTDDTWELVLRSIASGRLVILAGAGLSMASPSNIPSAADLAETCAKKHESLTSSPLDAALVRDLEAQAIHFRATGGLENYFISKLVEWAPFRGEPNAGHIAIADFLECDACDLAITTNFDYLIERAAERLGDVDFSSALDGTEASVSGGHSPLLKLHGCCVRGRRETLWCRQQQADTLWNDRIRKSTQWLSGRLMQRDLVFLGYWTDWEYLSEVLFKCIGSDSPSSVVLVDPSEETELEAKASRLWSWVRREGISFRHVRMSGAVFLDELRRQFSLVLLTQISEVGRSSALASSVPSSVKLELSPNLTTSELYDLRRDWTGVSRSQPTRTREAKPEHERLGAFVLELLAAGAVFEDGNLVLNGHHFRLIHAAGRMLYSLRAQFSSDQLPVETVEFLVAVGADDDGGARADIVRGAELPTIMRRTDQRTWLTVADARSTIGLT